MLPTSPIQDRIFVIRGQKVMLDFHLAELYEVETRVLNQAVKRNSTRFPDDFMFQLTEDEFENLRSQFVISSSDNYGGRRYAPFAFTEQGVAMLSSVLRSERAVQVNIGIMRAFVAMRQYALTHQELAQKLHELEQRYDKQFTDVFEAINYLISPPAKRRSIGFGNSESIDN